VCRDRLLLERAVGWESWFEPARTIDTLLTESH
jgi:hypothetical protein